MENMNAHEERKQLLDLATEMANERAQLLQMVNAIYNKFINRLVNAAEDLYPAALEASPENKGKAKAGDGTYASVEAIANHEDQGRKCSNCGQHGHTRRTCENKRKETPAPVEKKKRKMKPLSEEAKEKRRAGLVKARAARAKKRKGA